MNDVEPRGAVHWIDHYVVGTNDMSAWVDWAINATGLPRQPIIGLSTAERKNNRKITSFLWWDGGSNVFGMEACDCKSARFSSRNFSRRRSR